MPTITAIKQQKNKMRVNIYLDGSFAFGLDMENFMKHNLKVEQEMSEDMISEIKSKGGLTKAYGALLRFAMARPRSVKEINDWHKRKDVHLKSQKILNFKLNKLGLLGDDRFAEWWVTQRIEFKNKSIKELQFELRNKGIEKRIIDIVLSHNVVDEYQSAQELIDKGRHKWSRYDESQAKKKKAEYLMRKGFPWNIVKRVLDGDK